MDDTEVKIVDKNDIKDENAVYLDEKDFEDYFAPVPAEELPDSEKLKTLLIEILEFMNQDDIIELKNENKQKCLQVMTSKFPAHQASILIEYLIKDKPLEDLIDTIEMMDRIKKGDISYDEGREQLQHEKMLKYVPEKLHDTMMRAQKGESFDQTKNAIKKQEENKNLSRKQRRYMERIAKKHTKGKGNAHK